ncbi:hypothetical protein L7F22_012366 [Adiantum nelumboides]|nr:hypothetical protein [Adiantum nelumboides]
MPPLAEAVAPLESYPLSVFSEQEITSFCKKPWSASKSSSLYKISSWGSSYFTVNASGHMAVRPFGPDTKPNDEIDILQTLQKAMEDQLLGDLCPISPVIVRFPDILKNRLERLQSAFDIGIKALRYQGHFQGVFPVKCNQDRFVVENIVEFGKPYSFGLEAGSKPELLLAMSSLCKGCPDALLICNGYKDAEYVSLALLARKIKLNCVIVLEQEEELDLVLDMSRKLCIEPLIGLRAKLNTKHAGHFGETSGENGKFGLSCAQIIGVVCKLRRSKMLHCLQLLHFHIGSQIPSLHVLNDGVSEAAHIYCELSLMGANMQYIDIGGGLGVDYDGSCSAESDMSVGYSMEEYAKEVVLAVKRACQMKGVKQPTLCSESGRALVSHHSVLVFMVLSSEEKNGHFVGDKGLSLEVDDMLPEPLCNLQECLASLVRVGNYESALEYAQCMKLTSAGYFKEGALSLMQLAFVNTLYELVAAMVEKKRYDMATYDGIYGQWYKEAAYNVIYHINLSIFKSMPDTWAIGQRFPIVPLHRLDEEPTVRAILSDLTCDSDGKITTFVGNGELATRAAYMKAHLLQEGKPYYMGMFLGGAYQEALGGMHNLFGAPPVVHIMQATRGEGNMGNLQVLKVNSGQNIYDVLKCMQYEPFTMLETLHGELQNSLKDGDCHDQEEAMCALDGSFFSSTYLSANFTSTVGSTLLPTIVIG